MGMSANELRRGLKNPQGNNRISPRKGGGSLNVRCLIWAKTKSKLIHGFSLLYFAERYKE